MNRLKQFVTRLRRPDTREVAVAQVSDKYSEYPSNGLTPVKLAEIFREADAGDVLRQMELFEEMEEKDPHLFSQLQTRKNAVTGLDFEVIPFGDEPLDKEIADFIEEQLNGIESFEDVENDLLDAIGKGFAVSEILWGYDEGHVVVQDIKTRHQKRFFWDTLDDSFKVRTKDAPEGILLPANKFIVHKYKARSGHTSRAGILRVVAWMYLFKNYDLKDWAIVLEALTQPGDVFYDAEFGWGLYDFIQSEDTELTRLEITQRVRLKLQKREVILPESIEISIAFEDDAVVLHCSFRFAEEDERRELDVIIGAVSVEVVSE